ncbi:HNH endonuclease family protein [Dermatophilaceae bacterium Soc4.6]
MSTAAVGLVLDRTVHATSSASDPALAAVDALPVVGEAPAAAYDRAAFGQAWLDTDRNGCDTRNDVLRRDLVGARLKPGTRGCVVLAGTLTDPYSGAPLDFVRGASTSQLVQVDHVVALADAWRSGAAGWSTAERESFANDPLELLAVDGRLNSAKGDGDAATWLPPSTTARCAYAARQVAVKLTWHLAVTQPEADALRAVLGACPEQQLPSRSPFVLGPPD